MAQWYIQRNAPSRNGYQTGHALSLLHLLGILRLFVFYYETTTCIDLICNKIWIVENGKWQWQNLHLGLSGEPEIFLEKPLKAGFRTLIFKNLMGPLIRICKCKLVYGQMWTVSFAGLHIKTIYFRHHRQKRKIYRPAKPWRNNEVPYVLNPWDFSKFSWFCWIS